MMTVIAMDASSSSTKALSTKSAWRWIALLSLFSVGALIVLTTYDVVYGCEEKTLTSEAKVEAQQQATALQSELEKQRSMPMVPAMDADLVESVRAPSPQHSIKISKKLNILARAIRGAVAENSTGGAAFVVKLKRVLP